ncbi:MAG: HerA-ATP synthase, barrel domain protein [candidate division TM6 bacterium GW2011_GWF2_30_66]|jgi:hypothetical protein|nr:MAG: HerA-ATP synthase, barrel domain protein [candidate division TM6 bacterium GW2011_GWF2_30_66]
MPQNTNNNYFAEVIESSLQEWKAQCWDWNKLPSFGSIVTIKSGNKTIFGVVHQIQTGSDDPSRHPFAYQKTEEELMREQPQIFEYLKTTFSCITIGYKNTGKIYYMLSSEPPKIHSFVGHASPEDIREFFSSSSCRYLHLLFGLSGQIFNLEELLLAIIIYQVKLNVLNKENKKTKINKFIETYSLLIGNDYRKLKLFLQRVEPLIGDI